MVAINYAKDIRVGGQPAKAVALGSNFVWPPLPERLFFRGQSLAYDFVRQRYGTRLPGHVTIVAGETPIGSGYISEAFAARQGAPDLATGSISAQPLPGTEIEGVLFGATSSASQLTIYFLGDVMSSLDGIRVWVGGVELAGTPDIVDYYPQADITVTAYNNPNMDPWVDGGQYNIGITLDGSEPSAIIDYTTNINDLGILTRASTATYWGPSGSLLEAAVDEARIQHDPVTGEALGVLVERSATNSLSPSWYSNFIGQYQTEDNITVTQDAAQAPDGTQTAVLVEATDVSGIDELSFRWEGTTASLARSVFIKPVGNIKIIQTRVSATTPWLTYNVETGETSRSSNFILRFGREPVIEASKSGWIRLDGMTRAPGEGGYWSMIRVRPLEGELSEGDGVLVWGTQDEEWDWEGQKPFTSYIPTIDSPVTRAADEVSIDLSDVFNPDEGTYVVRAVVKDDGDVEYYAGWYDSQISERFAIRRISGGIEIVADSSPAGYREVFSVPGEVQVGDVITIAMAYSDGECVGSAFGEVVRDSSGGFLSPSSINLVRGVGGTSAQYNASLESSGVIAGFEYYPRALTEEELARITAFTLGDNS